MQIDFAVDEEKANVCHWCGKPLEGKQQKFCCKEHLNQFSDLKRGVRMTSDFDPTVETMFTVKQQPHKKRRVRLMRECPDNPTLKEMVCMGLSVMFPVHDEQTGRLYAAVSYWNRRARTLGEQQRFDFRVRNGMGCVELQRPD